MAVGESNSMYCTISKAQYSVTIPASYLYNKLHI